METVKHHNVKDMLAGCGTCHDKCTRRRFYAGLQAADAAYRQLMVHLEEELPGTDFDETDKIAWTAYQEHMKE